MRTEYNLTPQQQTAQIRKLLDAVSYSTIIERVHMVEYNPNYVGLFLTVSHKGQVVTILINHKTIRLVDCYSLSIVVNQSIRRAHKNVIRRRHESIQAHLKNMRDRAINVERGA